MSRVKLLLLAASLTVVASCASVQKQRMRAEKFYNEHPAELAEKCASNFPPTYKQGKEQERGRDTVYLPGDTLQCPPIINPTTGESHPGKTKTCPPGKIVYVDNVRVDTVESTALLAKLAALQLRNMKLTDDLDKTTKEKKEAIRTAEKRQLVNWGLLAVVGAGGLFILKKYLL